MLHSQLTDNNPHRDKEQAHLCVEEGRDIGRNEGPVSACVERADLQQVTAHRHMRNGEALSHDAALTEKPLHLRWAYLNFRMLHSTERKNCQACHLRTWAGVAVVTMSKSFGRLLRSRSRTAPPTTQPSCPAPPSINSTVPRQRLLHTVRLANRCYFRAMHALRSAEGPSPSARKRSRHVQTLRGKSV